MLYHNVYIAVRPSRQIGTMGKGRQRCGGPPAGQITLNMHILPSKRNSVIFIQFSLSCKKLRSSQTLLVVMATAEFLLSVPAVEITDEVSDEEDTGALPHVDSSVLLADAIRRADGLIGDFK